MFLQPDQLSRASLVLRMARIASTTQSLSLILRATMAEMDREGLKGALIALIEQEDRFYVAAVEGEVSGSLANRGFRVGHGALGTAAGLGRSVVVGDMRADNAPQYGIKLAEDDLPRSLAVVPIRAGRRVIGILELEASLPNSFDEDDLGILEDISLAISGAVQSVRLQALHERLDNAERVIFSLARAVEAKDSLTEAHTERVALRARELGARAGLIGADLDDLYRGGMIHDIGKIGIPDAILLKPAPLSNAEFKIIHQHPELGVEIARPLRSAASLLSIIRHHHERIDGGGYPDGLTGEEIPIMARIVSICDAFDAMISDRPYRRGKTVEEAIAILRQGAGRQWDGRLVELFVEMVREEAAGQSLAG
jgi:putative nucleotidyltransferase with HDIG domain